MGSSLDLEAMLHRIAEAAVGLVGARYGALGVIGEGDRLAEFLPVGLQEQEIAGIDHWPEGKGLLGLLRVTDNGIGIGRSTRRSGLANMSDRAQLFGGTFSLRPADPTTGTGTIVEWRVPRAA